MALRQLIDPYKYVDASGGDPFMYQVPVNVFSPMIKNDVHQLTDKHRETRQGVFAFALIGGDDIRDVLNRMNVMSANVAVKTNFN